MAMTKPKLTATAFLRPNGKQEIIEVNHVNEDDARWFIENNIKISIEEDGRGGFVVYGDYGAIDPEDLEPVEAIELSMGRNCQDTLKSLREKIEKAKAS